MLLSPDYAEDEGGNEPQERSHVGAHCRNPTISAHALAFFDRYHIVNENDVREQARKLNTPMKSGQGIIRAE